MSARKYILIVGGDSDSQKKLFRALENDYFVPVVCDGKEALMLLGNRFSPDLMIVDLDVSGFTGNEHQKAFEINPRTLKIVVSENDELLLRTPADGRIGKPVDLKDLTDEVRRLLH